MMSLNGARRHGLLLLLAGMVLFLVVQWLRQGATLAVSPRKVVSPPELFLDRRACPARGLALENGRRAEERGLLRADRYAYDPRDGVRAVRRFREAESCYLAAGADAEAFRTRRASAALIARVNTDYAAARLNLTNALEQERWTDALREIRRLLLLTDHLRRNEYVDWLKDTIGGVAARAGAAP